MKSLNKKTFSIKIEKTTENAHIYFGFCAKTADNSANIGYYTTQFSFMLYLRNGSFYSRSLKLNYIETDLKQPALNQEIFSVSLDLKSKTLKFYLNGKLIGNPQEIDLKPEEEELMCPCVDLVEEGDRVSLVFQEVA